MFPGIMVLVHGLNWFWDLDTQLSGKTPAKRRTGCRPAIMTTFMTTFPALVRIQHAIHPSSLRIWRWWQNHLKIIPAIPGSADFRTRRAPDWKVPMAAPRQTNCAMKSRSILSRTATIAILCLLGSVAPLLADEPARHTFAIGTNDFLLDGRRLQIRCGEIHAARVPREYWRHRLQMARAMGLNTVCAYLFW